MAANKVGTLIKEARTKAGLTQEQLAKKVAGCSASDIGKAERGEKELTQDQLKAIAKATGVTQKSLLDAAKGTSSKPASAKPAASTKPAASKPAASSSGNMKLSAEEKKLIELYRKADEKTKKATAELLGEGAEPASNALSSILGGSGNLLGSLLGGSGGSLISTLLGGSSSSSGSGSSGTGSLLGSLLGGNSSGSGSSGGSGDLLGSLLGGAASLLGGKREMPQEDGDK